MAYNPEKGYQQQPQAVPAMTLNGGGNRNVKNLPMGPNGREWSNGLCSCCDVPGTCCLAWCCPCMLYSKNKQRLDHLNHQGTPDPEHGGSGCSGDCCLHGLISVFCGGGWILQFMQRGNVRSRYNISGGSCGDCCAAFCCSPCQQTQVYQELELEEKSFPGRQ